MHGIDLSHSTHFYVDVSGFGAGLAITQKPTTDSNGHRLWRHLLSMTTLIHTEHKPPTFFTSSDFHEDIYGHWADQLQRLNINIVYIPGAKTKAVDGSSRTIFDSDDNLSIDTTSDITKAMKDLKKKAQCGYGRMEQKDTMHFLKVYPRVDKMKF